MTQENILQNLHIIENAALSTVKDAFSLMEAALHQQPNAQISMLIAALVSFGLVVNGKSVNQKAEYVYQLDILKQEKT